ncbi:MAG TPA: pilus assembly protein TadD [Bacteroidetes bacterium]|nr:pilus assembly protein TadD [Bacteroidota bacterium]
MRRSWWVLSSILLFSFLLVQCMEEMEEENAGTDLLWLNHHDSVSYVGMDACRACHSDKFETFQHTGMGQSFDHATTQKSQSRFHGINPVYDKEKDFYYIPYFRNDSLFFKEYRLNSRGDTIYQREEHIAYIVGSGQHTHSHILNFNGFLYQAPLTWYAQKGKWDLPPGFENGNNSRFSRLIGEECMSCHNALPEFDFGSENKYLSVPQGIDCERCHGPGELHVQQKKAGILVDVSKEADYSIVNPRRLRWDLQVDVCQRCHLQGNTILEPGKSFHDFRPGMPLNSVMTVFMPRYEGEEEGFIMASHAQRLQKSQCFIQSNAQSGTMNLTCISCHNPHVSVKVTGKKVYNDACQGCHQENTCTAPESHRKTKENNCVACHMPAEAPSDIPHVNVHDHYIRKPQTIKSKNKGHFAGLYAVNNANPSAAMRIKAYLSYYEKFERGNTTLLDSAEAYLVQGGKANQEEWIRLAYLQNDFDALLQIAVTYSGRDEWTWYRIARAQLAVARYQKALISIKKALLKKPYSLDFQNEKAVILIQLEKYDEAMDVLNTLLKWQPKQAKSLCNRGFVFETKGEVQAAKKDYLAALDLDPDYELALINMCRISLSEKDKTKAKVYLLRLQKANPNHPSIKIISQSLNN